MKIKLLLILTCIAVLASPKPGFGQAPSLGAASSFTLFTSVGAFNALGPSIVTGDVGTNAGLFTGFPPGTITGSIHVEDATSLAAAGDLALAYGTLEAMTCGAVLGVGLGGGQVLAPNVYCTGAATTLNGDLTLDGGGDPDALFVIKIDGSFITGNSSNVFLINGASINNVFWWVTGEFSLGNSSAFKGNVIGNGAISLLASSSLIGRALTKAGAIAMDGNNLSLGTPPAADAGTDRSVCLGSSTQIGAAAVIGSTYSWTSVPAGFTSTAANPTVTPLVTTVYTLVETTTSTGLTNTHSVTVTVNPLPAAAAGANRTICLNSPTQIGAAAVVGSTYSWTSNPAGYTSALANPTVTPLVTTTYTVVETITATGCTNSNSVTVTVNPLPAAIAGANRTVCQSTPTQIGAVAVVGSTYSWTSNPAGYTSTEANPIVTPLLTTTYTVVETTTATGCTNSNSVIVTVNPLPGAIAGANRAICLNSSTQIGAAAVLGSTYSWTSNPVGFTSILANPVVTPLLNTTYTVVETITATGCTNSNSVTVTVNPLPAAIAGANRTVCQNSPTQIGAVAVVGSTYSWTSNPAGYTSTEANPFVTPLLTTTYTVVETITASGCTNSNSVDVSVNPMPAAAAGANRAICINSSTQIGAVAVVGSTYSWTSNPVGFTSNLANPVVTPLQTTTYTVTETITATGCTNSNSVTVSVNLMAIALTGGNQSVCGNDPYYLNGSSAQNAVSMLWSTSGTGLFDIPSALHPTYTPSAADILAGSVTLTLTVNPASPCVPVSDNMVLTIERKSIIYAGPDASVCASSVTYAVTGATGQNATSYLWTSSGTGTFVNATLLNPVYTPSSADYAAGGVTLTLTGVSTATCGNTIDQMILTFIHCTPSGYNITKSAMETSYSAVGDLIHYTITVSNKGSETIYNSTVTDPNAIFSSGNQISILRSNTVATFLAAHTITQSDIDAGQVINCAFVSGTFADGVQITGASPCITTIGVQRPQVTATKFSSEKSFHAAGDVIHYSIEVFNCGTVTLSNLTVTDPRVSFTQGNLIASLPPATTQSVNAVYVVTPADVTAGRIANIATVSGYDPMSQPISILSNELVLYTNDQARTLSVSKIALENRFMEVGETLHYEITVTNYKVINLLDIFVTDSLSVITEGSPIVRLNSGYSATINATHVITQADLDAGRVVSKATASTTDNWLFKETAISNELTVFAIQGPRLLLSTTAREETYSTVGESISFTHGITNTGNVKISGIKLSDPQGTQTGHVPIADLNPGEFVSVTTSYIITQSDLDVGTLEQTARISGFDQNNRLIQSSGNSLIIPGTQKANLSTTLTAAENSFSTIGEVIHYSVEAFNTGNVTLTDLILSGQESDLSNGKSIAELMPGHRATVTAEHRITAEELAAGKVVSLATIRAYDRIGQQISGESNQLTILVQSIEDLAVAMTVAETSYGSVGEAIHYMLTVKNNSDLPASNITVADPLEILSGNSMIATLPRGESATLPALHTITQADLDAGMILGSPTITGFYSDGSSFVESGNPVTIFAHKKPQLTTMVEASETRFNSAGDQIHYAIVVKNTGNQSLTGITLADQGILTFSGTPAQNLAPGESAVLTAVYTITLADMDAGKIVQSFNSTAWAPDQQSVVASSNEISVPAMQNPELSTTAQAVESTFSEVGEWIHYTIRVENTGNVTLIS
ncbi:MAG TPA: hypothetical protein DC042_18485, partial [Bacteroidales bacterium]|nr:hypothetical protein [Bacteroidales bacterium]